MFKTVRRPRRSLGLASVLMGAGILGLAACDAPSPLTPPDSPERAISHGPSGSMIQQFFFLAPAVPNPDFEFVGDFDGSLSPVVEICRWEEEACQGPVVARYTTGGQGADRIRVSMEDEHYLVNWRTQRYGLTNDVVYRVRVVVDDLQLGYMDVVPVANPGQAGPEWDPSEFVVIRNGSALPVKFRIEENALVPAGMIGHYYLHCPGPLGCYQGARPPGIAAYSRGARVCLGEHGHAKVANWWVLVDQVTGEIISWHGSDPGPLTCSNEGTTTWSYRESILPPYEYEIYLGGSFFGYVIPPPGSVAPPGIFRQHFSPMPAGVYWKQ